MGLLQLIQQHLGINQSAPTNQRGVASPTTPVAHTASQFQQTGLGRPVLGLQAQPADTPSIAVRQQFTPVMPTLKPIQSNMQRYGNAQGQQWLENPQGQQFAITPPKQAFDSPLANRQVQPLRPGIRGYFPTSDATVRGNLNQPIRIQRI